VDTLDPLEAMASPERDPLLGIEGGRADPEEEEEEECTA